jgi:hypothetical protein
MLAARGVPFAERTVSSNEDIEAFKRLAGSGTLPLLTVGGQQLRGYSESEWTQFLDAAGYPKSSQLPPRYVQPPASPLVAVQQPAQRQAEAEPPRHAPARPALAAPAGDNPAGITF